MSDQPEEPPVAVMTAHVEMGIMGRQLSGDITVPAAPVRVDDLLPVLQSLSDAIISVAKHEAQSVGKSISCRKGCGACCRQMVPISEPEARRIRDLVDSFPEPRRSEVRARFAEGLRRVAGAGLLEPLEGSRTWDKAEHRKYALRYFAERIACPFLEEESCSIHAERPIVCREYLVTTPPENCATPTLESVEGVVLPTRLWRISALVEGGPSASPAIHWVPLIQALEWADSQTEEPPRRPGPDLLREILGRLTGDPVPPPPAAPFPVADIAGPASENDDTKTGNPPGL